MTMSQAENPPCWADAPPALSPFSLQTYIAVDANQYHVRVVHTTTEGVLLDTLAAKTTSIPHVVKFVRRIKESYPAATLTGARYDRWPHGLYPALVQQCGPVLWADDNLLSKTAKEFRHATKVIGFFRATWLAACAPGRNYSQPQQIASLMHRWRKATLEEFAFALDLGPPPEIPF